MMPPDVRRARVNYEGHLSSHRWRFFVPTPGTYWAGVYGGEQTWRAAYDRACALIRHHDQCRGPAECGGCEDCRSNNELHPEWYQ